MNDATIAVVADTQVVIWYLLEPDRLSPAAREALEAPVEIQQLIGVSAWALVEIAYAVEKANNPLQAVDREVLVAELGADDSPFEVVPVTADIATAVFGVPRERNADPGDRVVVATAETLGVPMVSSDTKLAAMTDLDVIW